MSITENSKDSQVSMVFNHLMEFGSISDVEAYSEYGIRRLSARIWDLRHKFDLNIISTPESGKNRFGKKINYTRYTLGGTA